MVICWERADLLAIFYVMFSCVFVTFSYDLLDQVWLLIVWIPDFCSFPYFKNIFTLCFTRTKHQLSLIRDFVARLKKAWINRCPLSALRRRWSERAGLSHTQNDTFGFLSDNCIFILIQNILTHFRYASLLERLVWHHKPRTF